MLKSNFLSAAVFQFEETRILCDLSASIIMRYAGRNRYRKSNNTYIL